MMEHNEISLTVLSHQRYRIPRSQKYEDTLTSLDA